MTSSALAIALTVCLVPIYGTKALWWLGLGMIGGGFAAVYGPVGRRLRRLKATLPAGDSCAEVLICNDSIQSPGLAWLRADRLELVPLTGPRVAVPWTGIAAIREVRWMYGFWICWKKGFLLELPDGHRIGVVIPRTVAPRWQQVSSRGFDA